MSERLPITRLLAHLGALAAVGLLAACASGPGAAAEPERPTPSGGGSDIADRTVTGGFTIEHPAWKELGYRWDWTGFSGLASGEQIDFCYPFDDLVIVQGDRASMSVLDARTGRGRWLDRLANPLTRFVGTAREGDTLYVAAESEVFIIDALTGNWHNRQKLEEVVNTSPLLFEGNLLFGTATGRVMSHRTDYGLSAWFYDIGSPIVADLVLVGGVVGAISQSGEGLFVDARVATGLGHPTIGAGLANNPVSDGERMYVASIDQSVYAFTPGVDEHLWRFRTEDELRTQPTLHEGVLYVTSPGLGLVALDPDNGSELWIGPDAGGEVIAERAGSLVVWDGTTLKAVDPTNGDVISSFETPGLTMLKAGAFVDGSLFGVTRAGAVIRFTPR